MHNLNDKQKAWDLFKSQYYLGMYQEREKPYPYEEGEHEDTARKR